MTFDISAFEHSCVVGVLFWFCLLGGDGSYGSIGWCDGKMEGQKLGKDRKMER